MLHVNSQGMDQVQQFFAFKISLALISTRYLDILPVQLRKKFRTSNHCDPVETGRWHIIPLNERLCFKYCVTKDLLVITFLIF